MTLIAGHRRRGRARLKKPLSVLFAVLAVAGASAVATGSAAAEVDAVPGLEVASLDGGGNNVANPTWGQSGRPYLRLSAPRYADGVGQEVPGVNPRRISNRIFNDVHQNIFSENGVTQWGFVWGQFLDHTFGLRRAPGVGDSPDPSSRNIPFPQNDPIEEFENDLGEIPFTRSSFTAGTGVNTPRQQDNTVSSYIDAFSVYSGSEARLEWLRDGPVDGNMANNRATLFLPGGMLPRRDDRGNPATAPAMDVDGRLRANPNNAAVAGDVRANENIALQATHTLFAREHNRIANRLPATLSQEDRFQIARRIVIAEQQFITYNEFLPALGINLPAYTGYKSNVNATLGNEFATVGYRAHSMIHGEMELETDADRYSPAVIEELEDQGVEVEIDGDEAEIVIPLNVAFFNPDLLDQVQLGPMLQGIGLEAQYQNDEMIDNQLRSVLFQVPVSGNPECLDGPGLPECFNGVTDLGAIDVQRAFDHGMPSYNGMRQAFGLPPKTSFTSITGESTDAFPRDPQLPPGNEVNDPDSLDFVRLADGNGNQIAADTPEAEAETIVGTRRTTTAARLRATFGSVNNIDAFTGMLAERHIPGSDFGELQRRIWTQQYQALRDGDRFFYGNDPGLTMIRQRFGIDFRVSLAQVIAANTDIPLSELNDNVFEVAEEAPANLALEQTATASPTCVASEGPEKAFNGSVSGGNSDKYCGRNTPSFLQVDLGERHTINAFVIRHAQAGGEIAGFNTRDFDILVSNDGTNFTRVVTVRGNTAGITSHKVFTSGRFVRLNVLRGEQGAAVGPTRIYEFEVYALDSPVVSPPTPGTTWQVGVAYSVGDVVTFQGTSYRCIQAHTSQSDWSPPAVPALWRRL